MNETLQAALSALSVIAAVYICLLAIKEAEGLGFMFKWRKGK